VSDGENENDNVGLKDVEDVHEKDVDVDIVELGVPELVQDGDWVCECVYDTVCVAVFVGIIEPVIDSV
jgi:hypothetical protein